MAGPGLRAVGARIGAGQRSGLLRSRSVFWWWGLP
jgi:hypothetical protein